MYSCEDKEEVVCLSWLPVGFCDFVRSGGVLLVGEGSFLVGSGGGRVGGSVEVGGRDRAVVRNRDSCGSGCGWLNWVSLRLLSSALSRAFGCDFLLSGRVSWLINGAFFF